MTPRSDTARYAGISIALHWLMLLVIVGVFAAMELREYYPKGSDTRNWFKSWHFTLGLTVFALVWVRIGARVFTSSPAPQVGPAWRTGPAKLVHLALYALMICMPLAGWALLSAEGDAIPFYGLSLPALIAKNPVLAQQIEWAHVLGGDIVFWLILAHAAAAIFHHYWLKDHLLSRMLPARR